MKLDSFTALVSALEDAEVRYLIVGGLAVNAHGYSRFTKDVDCVIQLVPENIQRTFAALKTLEYKPLLPITAKQFADTSLRNSWIREKNMQVLQFWSDKHQATPVDIFVDEPFVFENEYNNALIKPLFGKLSVRFVTIETLIAMKKLPIGHKTKSISKICVCGKSPMSDNQPTQSLENFDWQLTTFTGARREQLRRWADLPLEEIILALEEMQTLTEQLQSPDPRLTE
ncbi:MAG: hypothetical protein WD572_10535 [Gammaproteobacteria bacterium]